MVLIFLLAAILWFGIDLLTGKTFGQLFQIPWLLVLAVVAAVLHRKTPLSLGPLRALELTLFAAAVVYLSAREYTFIYLARTSGEGQALFGLTEVNLRVVLLVIVYGMFIPNTLRRAAIVATSLAAVPVASGLLLAFVSPSMADFFRGMSRGQVVEAGSLLALGVGVAVAGTQVIGKHQSQEMETLEAGLYQLKEKIGAGGMGEVWRAEHHKLVRPAAIKLIRPDRIDNADESSTRETIRRFEREAQATAALRSPHTVELYDFGVSGDGIFYYVMEFLDGIDLKTLVETHGPQPPGRAIHLLMQSCESLADAHERRMIHRDVKPANIFACRLGLSYDFVKVLDFGLVKLEDAEEHTQLTHEGMTAGSPAFMAPEMVTGKDSVDSRSDLYGLGCVGYWLLTGQYVFPRKRAMAMALDHATTPPRAPSEVSRTPIPEELDRIILKCLAKKPEDRFASAMELAEALSGSVPANGWGRKQAENWWKSNYPEA